MSRSAGILLYRPGARSVEGSGTIEVLLVHPGGPFWAKKDEGAWSIPKGEHGEADDPLTVARREFEEELGVALDRVAAAPDTSPAGAPLPLGEIRQKGGKVVAAWALEGDLDPTSIRSNTFEMEWPPRSGRVQTFPEVDRAAWFGPEAARERINGAQRPFLDRLLDAVGSGR